MMNSFFEKLRAAAEEAGFDGIEVFYQGSRVFTTKVFRGEIERYQVSEESGISIRGMLGDRIGYYYSERIDPEIIPEAIEAVRSNALLMTATGERIPDEAVALEDAGNAMPSTSYDQVPEMLMDTEKKLLGQSDVIVDVPYNIYSDVSYETRILSSSGLKVHQQDRLHYHVLGALARNEARAKTAVRVRAGRGLFLVDDAMVSSVAAEAEALLDAAPVASGVMDIILRADAAADILGAFSGIFSGEALEKGLTPLKERLGTIIGSAAVNLADTPDAPGALVRRRFDDEGTATREKMLIRQGRLECFLHNAKTAGRLDAAMTGNAYRGSIKSMMGISHTNLYMQPDASDPDTLVHRMGDGLLIIHVQALHSGLNPVSGDFSLPVQGYRIENGEKVGTVDQVTLSGNVLNLLAGIEAVGNDLYFDLPNAMGSVGSPSLWIKGLSVSGK